MERKLTIYEENIAERLSEVNLRFKTFIEKTLYKEQYHEVKYIINLTNGDVAFGGIFESHGHISLNAWSDDILKKPLEKDAYMLEFLISEKIPLKDNYQNQLMGGRLKISVTNREMVIKVHGISANENILSDIGETPVEMIEALLMRLGLSQKHAILVQNYY